MIKTVHFFKNYANEEDSVNIVHETCVLGMEQGLLHVDATNGYGWTLGYLAIFFLRHHFLCINPFVEHDGETQAKKFYPLVGGGGVKLLNGLMAVV